MRIVADENIELEIIDSLRKANYEVYSIREQKQGITDEEVLAEANKQGSLLLTFDTDFGELVYRLKYLSEGGIVLLRLKKESLEEKTQWIVNILVLEIPIAFLWPSLATSVCRKKSIFRHCGLLDKHILRIRNT